MRYFCTIEETLKEYFLPTQLYKVIRCSTLLEDITDPNEQELKMRQYHVANNHKGIDKTVAHLKDLFTSHY